MQDRTPSNAIQMLMSCGTLIMIQ